MSSNFFRFLGCIESTHEALVYLDLLIGFTALIGFSVVNNDFVNESVEYLGKPFFR